jgi:hypothetical protein
VIALCERRQVSARSGRSLRQWSHEALVSWSTPIDFLFVDGDHSWAGIEPRLARPEPSRRARRGGGLTRQSQRARAPRPEQSWSTRSSARGHRRELDRA